MIIDATTFSDLAVFGAADGSEGILDLVDRTRTSLGRKALRRRFEAPMTDARDIRRTQAAVRHFMRHDLHAEIEEETTRRVTRYLSSNIEVSRSTSARGRVEAAWMAVRYRDVLAELREGADAVVAWVAGADAFARRLRATGAPLLVEERVGTVERVVAAAREAVARGGGILAVDRALRDDLGAALNDAVEALADLDALRAMAAATVERGWTLPELVESESFHLEATDVWHPFVDGAVRNPVTLTGGEPMVFLTGPNMAGKTTYLRAVALVVLLAQVGMGVPARSARLTPVEALFTSLNPADNLRTGLSYFLAEVLRVKAAASLLAEGRRALVLFDEVFKGTNLKDALEASAEVILGFAKASRSGFVFSSHLAELVDVLAASPRIRFCYFDGEIVRGAPAYGYRLLEGVSDKRFGVLLLRQARIPELIARIGARAGPTAPGASA